MTTPELITPREAADALRVSRNSVYGWIRSGQLRSVRLGGLYRIARTELDAVMAGGFTPHAAPAPAVAPASVEQPAIFNATPSTSNTNPGVAPAPPFVKPGPHPNDGWITEQRR